MSEAINAGTKAEGGNKVAAFIRREIGRVTALASLVVIFTFFTVMRPVFASWANVSGGCQQQLSASLLSVSHS
jgi:ribose transport system permease protein